MAVREGEVDSVCCTTVTERAAVGGKCSGLDTAETFAASLATGGLDT